jgi:membrane protease YdiL (CAAX protease family)
LILALRRSNPALRAAVVGTYVLLAEWGRALIQTQPRLAIAALVLGGAALGVVAVGWPPDRLGLGTSRFGLRVLGGLALAAVLLLPAAVRSSAVPLLPAGLAVAAIAVSVGEELAFRGAFYAALDELGGAPVAILGSTVVWTAAHALSHPPAFLWAVAAAGLLLALWRWACRDLVAPIIGHVMADLAL